MCLASSNSGSPLALPAHTGPQLLCSTWGHPLSSIHGFIIGLSLLSFCNAVLSNYKSMHVERVVLEAQWRKVECQSALVSPLCFKLHAAPVVTGCPCLLLPRFANDTGRRLEDWRRGKPGCFSFFCFFWHLYNSSVFSVASTPTYPHVFGSQTKAKPIAVCSTLWALFPELINSGFLLMYPFYFSHHLLFSFSAFWMCGNQSPVLNSFHLKFLE